MSQLFIDYWPYFSSAVHVLIALSSTAHVVLNKVDTRASFGWIGVIWFAPIVGTLLYFLFGVNRIRRRARALRRGSRTGLLGETLVLPESVDNGLGSLASLTLLVSKTANRPLLVGNQVTPLVDGDEAYPAMLDAIDGATRSISLCTYIFNNDRAGQQFLDALQRAAQRGVEVRVLVDDVGSRYSWPKRSMCRVLRQSGVRAATFLPTAVPWRFRYANLRNHRKILVVDGQLGFTGGMNIREECLLTLDSRHPVKDLHFKVRGPVVTHFQETFAEDWHFTTDETLEGDIWFPKIDADGPVRARGITDGPDVDFEKLKMTLLGALSCAQSSVFIATPYFLPDNALITALNVAAMRGVEVDIVLPGCSNQRLVKWASMALLPQMLPSGCRFWLSPPPFNHTKLFVVDQHWLLIGSGNWDPRSLDLNFEFVVECYGQQLANWATEFGRRLIQAAEPVSLAELEKRPVALRLRDGLARLGSPYL